MKPIKIEHDMKYEGMYRLVWEDGIPSADMYNLTRANDILNNYDAYRYNMTKLDAPSLLKARSCRHRSPYSDLNEVGATPIA